MPIPLIVWGLGAAAAALFFSGCDGEEESRRPERDAGDGGPRPPNRSPKWNPLPDKYVNENETLSFPLRATDADNDRLVYSSSDLPRGASLSASGLFRWRPDYDQEGVYTIPVEVSDGRFAVPSQVVVHVNNVNRPPVMQPVPNQIAQEGQRVTFGILAADPDGEAVQITTGPLPRGASFNPGTGVFDWTPNYDQAGNYSVEFRATDGQQTVSQTVAISVGNVNRLPPELAPIGNRTVNEGQPLVFSVRATDGDGDPITYRATGLPTGAVFDGAAGTFRWTPTYRQAGSYNVTFVASDGRFEDSETIAITVNNVLADADGDGFREDQECNDDDASVRPIPEFKIVKVNSDLTICPGIYRGVNILVGSNNIVLTGTDVTLESASADLGGGAIQISGRSGVEVQGFSIENYEPGIMVGNSSRVALLVHSITSRGGDTGVYLLDSRDGTVTVDSISGGLYAMRLVNSQTNVIRDGDIRVPIRLESSHRNTLDGCRLEDTGVTLIGSNGNRIHGLTVIRGAIGLHNSDGNIIRGNQMSGAAISKIFLSGGSDDNLISDNVISGATGYGNLGSGGAIDIGSGMGNGGNRIEGNTLQNNSIGIHMLSASGGTIIRNTVRWSGGDGAQLAGGGIRGVTIEDNQITDNGGYGLLVGGVGPNFIRRNDLRRNGSGNGLLCGRNVCEGNLE